MGLPREDWLLLAGAVVGIGLAAYGIARPSLPEGEIPPGAVAVVDGQPIVENDYQRALDAVRRDRRSGELEPEDRRRVLDRLVDEELLLARAHDLGLTRRDSRARGALVQGVVDSVLAQTDGDPTEAELRAHYAAHRDYFTESELHVVEQLFFRAPSGDAGAAAEARARAVRAKLDEGEDFAGMAGEADDPVVALPREPLPVTKLADYLGPTAARTAARASVGAPVGPIRSSDGWRILRVVDRRGGDAPAYERIREDVLRDYRRRAGDRRLREYLDELRRESEVRVREDLR